MMNEVIKNMLERRSIRRYKPEQITDDELNTILQAGLYAPSAGSRQGVIIVACRNMEINRRLGEINHSHFHGRMSTVKVYISKDQPSIADDPTMKDGLYGAPMVLILFAPGNFLYSIPDCSVAAENMMLAAHALGIGSCMVMRAEDTFESDFGKQLQMDWGIDESYQARAFVTLGYPTTQPPQAKPRKENRIKVVD